MLLNLITQQQLRLLFKSFESKAERIINHFSNVFFQKDITLKLLDVFLVSGNRILKLVDIVVDFIDLGLVIKVINFVD